MVTRLWLYIPPGKPKTNKVMDATEGDLRIIIPCFGEEVAPRFESARRFRFWEVDRDGIVNYREYAEDEPDGVRRLRLMRTAGVNVIICNGIQNSYRQVLAAEGHRIIRGVVGPAADALFGFLAGRLKGERGDEEVKGTIVQTADLVKWTAELFVDCGWGVEPAKQPELYPVSLVGERICPVCGHPVRVAICCGAHAYKVMDEITEFHRVTAAGYQARVYVHQMLDQVVALCNEFGIELIDPSAFKREPGELAALSDIPPLLGRVRSHEKLNLSHQEV